MMGALAGGAAGGFAGHQVNHGFLGGVGGAVAGSMLEDAAKNHQKMGKKDKKGKKDKHHKRRGSRSSSSSSSSSSSDSSHGKRRGKVGNFHASSRDVRLEGRAILVAECRDTKSHLHRSTINLNDCLTNTSGQLRWAKGGNFAASSRQIHLADGGMTLVAELGDGRGGWVHNTISLNERITNEDGDLKYVG